MKELKTPGAAGGEVTGSRFILKSDNETNVGFECGMFQGPNQRDDNRNVYPNIEDPNEPEITIASHAHIDHIGLIHQRKGTVIMTPASKAIARISLESAESLSPELYPEGTIKSVFKRTEALEYHTERSVDGMTVTLENAGHILGSSIIVFKEKKSGETLVFSGDLGNANSHIVKAATPIREADIVVMETTYGDRNHTDIDPHDVLEDAAKRVMLTGGTLVIPSFAVDRTQSILTKFKKLRKENKIGSIPIFLDAPMSDRVTRVYENYRPLLREDLLEKKGEGPFDFDKFYTINKREDSDLICDDPRSKIVIAGSGMMTGGRVLKYADRYLSDSKSVFLFVGYPGDKTLSRKIVEKEKEVFVDGYGITSVDATILSENTSAFSSHADQKQLLDWLRHIQGGNRRLRQVILVHGEQKKREKFAQLIKTELGIENVTLPKENETINLYSNKS